MRAPGPAPITAAPPPVEERVIILGTAEPVPETGAMETFTAPELVTVNPTSLSEELRRMNLQLEAAKIDVAMMFSGSDDLRFEIGTPIPDVPSSPSPVSMTWQRRRRKQRPSAAAAAAGHNTAHT